MYYWADTLTQMAVAGVIHRAKRAQKKFQQPVPQNRGDDTLFRPPKEIWNYQ